MTKITQTSYKLHWLRWVGLSVFSIVLSLGAVNIWQSPQVHAAGCGPTQTFKTVWKTDNPGTTTSTQIRIPTTGSGYSYRVDINGDGDFADTIGSWNEMTLQTGTVTIDFGAPGTYPVAICGSFPRVYINNIADREKILSVTQWGDNAWTSMSNAFYGASNLDIAATDAPVLSGLSSLSQMFRGATAMVGNTVFNTWDVSNVSVMTSAFLNASSFNQPLDNWDVSNVTTFQGMFQEASSFNQDISAWDLDSANSISHMFRGAVNFNQPLGAWSTSTVTNMNAVFWWASSFNQDISSWETGNVTTMMHMFSGVKVDTAPPNVTLTGMPMTFNQDLSDWDTSSVVSMFNMFGSDPEAIRDYYVADGYTNITILDNGDVNPFNQNLGNWDMSSISADPGGAGAYTGATAMLSRSSLSPANYDATLTDWSAQILQTGVVLGVHDLSYCSGEPARQTLIAKGWSIEGDSQDCIGLTASPYLINTGMNQLVPIATSVLLSICTIIIVCLRNSVVRRYKYSR